MIDSEEEERGFKKELTGPGESASSNRYASGTDLQLPELVGFMENDLRELADDLPEVNVGLFKELVNAEAHNHDGQVYVGHQSRSQIRQLT